MQYDKRFYKYSCLSKYLMNVILTLIKLIKPKKRFAAECPPQAGVQGVDMLNKDLEYKSATQQLMPQALQPG